MFTDDLFIMKLSPNMIHNFEHFGYSFNSNFTDEVFQGLIHRFAVFYDPVTHSLIYKTVKKHTYNNDIKAFKSLFSKLNKDEKYKLHDEYPNGKPVLENNQINEANLHI